MLFLGAGASKAVGLDDLQDLTVKILDMIILFYSKGTIATQGPSRCGDTTPRKCYHHRTMWNRCNNTICNC
jgi:hypothetical protein